MRISRRRAALLVAGLLALGLLAWPVVSTIAGGGRGRPSRATGLPLDETRAALASVHSTACNAHPAAGAFDFDEIARRALGRHWRDRTEAERAEFVELLGARFLGWYSRLCERQELLHFQPPVVDGDRAVLSARAIREGRAVAVVYRLHAADKKHWLVYDVEVAGRSRTQSFYTDLDRIILNEGYGDMVDRLRDDLDAPRPPNTR